MPFSVVVMRTNSPVWAGEARDRNAFYRVGKDVSEGSDSIESKYSGEKKKKDQPIRVMSSSQCCLKAKLYQRFSVCLFACLR